MANPRELGGASPDRREPRTYGYVRVSTDTQRTALQIDALNAAGVDELHTDEGVSGKSKGASRRGFRELLARMLPGDTLVVYSVSRFGRSAADVLANFELLRERGIVFRSVTEPFDPNHYTGKLVLTILAAVAEMERDMLVERTRDGLAAARARGATLGARRKTLPEGAEAALREAVASGVPVAEAARMAGVSRGTARRLLART